jgi:hypothetical protein
VANENAKRKRRAATRANPSYFCSEPPRTVAQSQTISREIRSQPFQSDAFGPPELCTWPVGPGTCRFQTNQPSIARKLSQRSGAGLVAWSVNGGYLRIFQERISPRSARKLVTRYLKSLKDSDSRTIKATNARFLGLKRQRNRRNSSGRLRRRGKRKTEPTGF